MTIRSSTDQRNIEDLLVHCLRTDGDHDESTRLSTLVTADSAALFDLARRQSVAPLLYHRLRARGLGAAAPAILLEGLRKSLLASAARNMCLYAQFRQIAAALHAEQIPLIVLKGMFLADVVYPNIAVRPMADIDILVARQDVERAAGVLIGIGYDYDSTRGVDFPARESKHLPMMVRDEAEAAVEIHRGICDSGESYFIDTAELFERSLPTTVSGLQVLRLSPEDLLLHLCTHMAYQNEFRMGLRPVCDVAATVDHYAAELNWTAVSERAVRWGIVRGTYASLLIAQRLFGAHVPSDVLVALKPTHVDQDLPQLLRDRLFISSAPRLISHPTPQFVHMLSRTSLKEKVHAVIQRAMVDRNSLALAYNVPNTAPGIYLCYLRRWCYLLTRYSPFAINAARRGDPAAGDVRLITAVHRWLIGED